MDSKAYANFLRDIQTEGSEMKSADFISGWDPIGEKMIKELLHYKYITEVDGVIKLTKLGLNVIEEWENALSK